MMGYSRCLPLLEDNRCHGAVVWCAHIRCRPGLGSRGRTRAAADSGDNGAYYSSLRRIDDHNVTQLGFAWEYRTGTTRALEATPVVVGKTLYRSGNWGVVYALNATSGEQLWTFDPHNDGQTGRNTCCDVVNRGVVDRDGRVFVASNDGRLFALEATTGKVIWSADTFAAGEARSSTGAPQLAGDVVLIGNSGTDLGPRGVRGYVTAYEIATGRLRWRFYVVPAHDESNPSLEMQRALRTWDPKATPSGGAVWAGTSYDPKLDLIYIGTGNAAPHQPEGRNPSGKTLDNLYTSCVIALNAHTAGNLVFPRRADGSLVAYAADSGRLLRTLQTGVGIMAAPATYEADGTQYVVVMEGCGGGAIGLPFPAGSAGSRYQNIGRIVAFRLGGGAVPLPEVRKDLVVEPPPPQHASADEIDRGGKLYVSYCSRCHVFGAGVLPDLRRLPAGIHSMFADIVLRGRLRSLGMGRFDDVLTDQDVSNIHVYLLSEAAR
jgi:mono/diheme cytochrome c family protein